MYSVARQGLTGHGYVEKEQPHFRHVFFLDVKSQRENTVILSRVDNIHGRRQEVRKYNDRSLRLDFVRIPLEEVHDAWQDSLKDEVQQENILERFQIDSADAETILDPNEVVTPQSARLSTRGRKFNGPTRLFPHEAIQGQGKTRESRTRDHHRCRHTIRFLNPQQTRR